MDWITDDIAIGNYLDARDAALLQRHAFRSVVSLDGTFSAADAAGFGLSEVACYRLIDGAGNDPRVFGLAVDDLQRLASSQCPVLVQCHAGRSRSVAVVAAYLIRAKGMAVEQALAHVASKRPSNVTPALVKLLRKVQPGDA